MSHIPEESSRQRMDNPPSAMPSNAAVDPVALRTWLRLLTCHNQIEARLRNQLRNGFDTTLPRFDLMAQLERHPEGLKMRELSRLLMVTGGNITGLVDRLAEEGLIERRDDPRDRRAYYVSLTPKGLALFKVMAREHEQWVTELFQGLEKREMAQLWSLLGRLKSVLGGEGRRSGRGQGKSADAI